MPGKDVRADQLGVQAHCLRFEIASGLESALTAVAGLGVRAIEMMSFPGCRGNPWGDFGPAADVPPERIAAAMREAGLACPSVMVHERELRPEHRDRTMHWIHALGVSRIVLTAIEMHPRPTLRDWQIAFDQVLALATTLRSQGFQLILHTQPDLWHPTDGTLPADLLLRYADPDLLPIEFDPSGAIIHRAKPAAYLRQRPEVFYGLHLRDAMPPKQPVAYLPARPLGTGCVNWQDLLMAARESALNWYFLEMEVPEPSETLPAIETSRRFLESRGLLND
jgi:sugar phosphate isomerase/epimerase